MPDGHRAPGLFWAAPMPRKYLPQPGQCSQSIALGPQVRANTLYVDIFDTVVARHPRQAHPQVQRCVDARYKVVLLDACMWRGRVRAGVTRRPKLPGSARRAHGDSLRRAAAPCPFARVIFDPTWWGPNWAHTVLAGNTALGTAHAAGASPARSRAGRVG